MACAAAACLVLAGAARAQEPAPPPPFDPPPADAAPLLEAPPAGPPFEDAIPPAPDLPAIPLPGDAPPPTDEPGFPEAPPATDAGPPPLDRVPRGAPQSLPPIDVAPLAPLPTAVEPPPTSRIPVGARAPDGTMSVLAPPVGVPPSAPSAAPPSGPPGAPPVASPPAAPATSPAGALLARAMTPPTLPGTAADPTTTRALALLEALERSGDRSRRLWITQAYWKLAAAAARYRFALDAEDRLTLIAPGGDAGDLPLLDLAVAAARGEAASAGVEFVAAQQELVDLVRLPVVEPAPWPADLPLTAAYQTHFETIFAARPATGRIRAIHRQLPMAHRALQARAEAAAAAEERFAALESLHARGTTPLDAVLDAHDTIREQEEAFVEAVRGYNLAIAEYVMAVADASVPDDRFASMLIGQPLPWRPAAAPDRVVPVSATGSPQAAPDAAPGFPPRFLQPPPGFVPVPTAPPAGVPAAAVPPGFAPLGG